MVHASYNAAQVAIKVVRITLHTDYPLIAVNNNLLTVEARLTNRYINVIILYAYRRTPAFTKPSEFIHISLS
jgi:hypothetical protein